MQPAYIYNPGLVTAWHYVTGVMSIIMLINASLVASALAVKEKETGTIEQLLMTPAQTGEMLLAKTTPVFVLMMVVMFVALVLAAFAGAPGAAFAQETVHYASVGGRLVDAQGGALPGAQVVARQVETDVVNEIMSRALLGSALPNKA